MAEFLIFGNLCLARSKTLPYVWKKYYKNEQHLYLVAHILTKISQNVCIHLPDITTSFGKSVDFISFFGYILIHYWWPFMSELLYLHQTFTDCVSYQFTHSRMSTCQMWLQIMEDSLIYSIFWQFSYIITYSKYYNFIKLL